MACFHPLGGWRSTKRNSSGRYSLIFKAGEKGPVTVPCGQCQGCRLDYSLQWAVRIMHEAQLHDGNSFITLTYNDEHLPKDGSLVKKHFQKFMKRLRFFLPDTPVRYFHCGEYGPKLQRPHYHAALFGYDFPDRELWKTSKSGAKLYRSPLLEKAWTKGYSSIGDLTFESAAYVARYVTKKVNGKKKADGHYEAPHRETGEIGEIQQEYATMSRNPGLGFDWFEKYHGDIYPNDYVVIDGRKRRVPKYYDNLLEKKNPQLHEEIKQIRRDSIKSDEFAENNTPERLEAREKVSLARASQLVRGYENGTEDL